MGLPLGAPGANLDAISAVAGPVGTGLCSKCNSPITGALTDPKFEVERIETINKILIESGAAFVPLKPDDADPAGWEQPVPPMPAQTATPKVAEVVNARFELIGDREIHDLALLDYRDHEIL